MIVGVILKVVRGVDIEIDVDEIWDVILRVNVEALLCVVPPGVTPEVASGVVCVLVLGLISGVLFDVLTNCFSVVVADSTDLKLVERPGGVKTLLVDALVTECGETNAEDDRGCFVDEPGDTKDDESTKEYVDDLEVNASELFVAFETEGVSTDELGVAVTGVLEVVIETVVVIRLVPGVECEMTLVFHIEVVVAIVETCGGVIILEIVAPGDFVAGTEEVGCTRLDEIAGEIWLDEIGDIAITMLELPWLIPLGVVKAVEVSGTLVVPSGLVVLVPCPIVS